MGTTTRTWILALAPVLGLLTVSCAAAPDAAPGTPATTSATATASTTSSAAPTDPAIIFSQLGTVYEGDLGVCPPVTPEREAACAEAFTSAGKIAEAMARIAGESPEIANGEEIATAAEDLADTVETAGKTGCYGMGAPAAAPGDLAKLCGTLVQAAQLRWAMLGSATYGY